MVAVEEERPGRALGVRRLGARGSAAPGLVPKSLNHGRVCVACRLVMVTGTGSRPHLSLSQSPWWL